MTLNKNKILGIPIVVLFIVGGMAVSLLATPLLLSTSVQSFIISQKDVSQKYEVQKIDDVTLRFNPGVMHAIAIVDEHDYNYKNSPIVDITPYEALVTLISIHFHTDIDHSSAFFADMTHGEKYYRTTLYVYTSVIQILSYTLLLVGMIIGMVISYNASVSKNQNRK